MANKRGTSRLLRFFCSQNGAAGLEIGIGGQHNLEQQIQARNTTGVTKEALKELSMMFKHFDKDKSGRLNHQEFKSCLRSLGYDLPMVEEGEPDPEFEAILDTVDPNR